MKRFPFSSARLETLRTSALAVLVVLLAAMFWLVASPSAMAQKEAQKVDEGGDCTVCHKNRNTQMYPCNSVAYRRHIAHGDTPAACPTVGAREE